MSLDHTARLGLPYLTAGQMQKHVTLNETLTRLDALVQCAVASRTTATPPADPPDGLMHILPEDVTPSDWSGAGAGALVRADSNQWFVVSPAPGLVAWVIDDAELVTWTGEGWTVLSGGGGPTETLPRLGVNTAPDDTNRFAARLNTALWTALVEADGGTGDLRYVMNKEAPAHVLSLLLQSGWSGRAELGLVGDDDLSLKVSSDGEVWLEALRVARETGRVSFSRGAARAQTTLLTTSGDYTVPAWARRVRVILTGGGGGGGGGAAGPSGTARFGGGGGGAGGRSDGEWPVEELAGTLQVVIGAGGNGGAGATSVGSGEQGGSGEMSSLASDGATLLTAGGGGRGGAGTTTSGSGGGGAFGSSRSNAGGAASLSGGGAGAYATRYDAAGGGGAGGSRDAAGTAGPGGPGGQGYFIGGDAQAAAGSAGAADALGGAGGEADLNEKRLAGGGGGGGGAAPSGAGRNGGTGGAPGGGGGGGGAGPTAGGVGGAGGGGRAVIVAWG